MKLVVLGPQSIDELYAMACEHCGRVPSSAAAAVAANDNDKDTATLDCTPAPLPHLPAATSTAIAPRGVQWVPVRDHYQLQLQWIMPELRSKHRYKPARYFSHLLGHEGLGTLLHVLRELHWVQELSANDVTKLTSAFSVFTLDLKLTEQGLEHIPDIVRAMYRYIALLQDIPAWVYDELDHTSELHLKKNPNTNPPIPSVNWPSIWSIMHQKVPCLDRTRSMDTIPLRYNTLGSV